MLGVPSSIRLTTLHSKYRLTLVVLLASLIMLGAVACQRSDSNWEAIQNRGTLRVGLDASFPPFENIGPDGMVDGLDADLAREIGHRLGLEIEFVNIAYDGLYDGLVVGRVDVLISGLTVRESELGRVAYTRPYFNAGDRLILPGQSDIAEMADLEGKALAVEYGAQGDVQAREWQRRLHQLNIIRTQDPIQALEALLAGEADAALIDGVSAQIALHNFPTLELGNVVREELYIAAVRNDNVTLLAQLNTVISEMLDDGTVGKLIEDWL